MINGYAFQITLTQREKINDYVYARNKLNALSFLLLYNFLMLNTYDKVLTKPKKVNRFKDLPPCNLVGRKKGTK